MRLARPPSGRVWTLPDIRVKIPKHHHLAAGSCPTHTRQLIRLRASAVIRPTAGPLPPYSRVSAAIRQMKERLK